ncbi:hypothetical protein Scep_000571 [Stephania cephalantha]|uniref:Leucine-rich repeat-containing N-terminal plant-type domain-containing protein n=1 Tax=Stephania cephalantha TaxID=152367 RepID=A0AAP0L7E2_9MAGN
MALWTPLISLALLTIFPSLIVRTKPCHPSDSSALLAFKNKITDDPYGLLTAWTKSTDCCARWEGAQCNSMGRVVNVSRPGVFTDDDDAPADTSMTGRLPRTLGNLSFLRLLDLGNLKFLEGPIPQNLVSLKKLYIDSNQLSGAIDSFVLGSWKSIRELGLIPTSIGKMKKLEELDLSQNQINGSIPSSLGRLSAVLEVLDLSRSMPSWFSKLSASRISLAQTGIVRRRSSCPDGCLRLTSRH